MSEVVEKPAEIVPAKSEDKLEIEKEEQEKVEDKEKVEESTSEKEKDTEKEEKTESEEKNESAEEKGEKDVADSEKKDTETPDDKDKKFSMPKIKTPKIIKEIRSRSKSREKKKKKDDNEDAPAQESEDDKKEEEKKEDTCDKEENNTEKEEGKASEEKDSATESKDKEADGKSEDSSEKKDVVKEAKSKVKDALDSIHLPKMPKMHKPAFLKKKTKEESEKTEESTEKNTEGEEKANEEPKEKTEQLEEKKEETPTEEKKEDVKDETKDKEEDKCEDKKEETTDETEKKDQSEKEEEGVEERKPSLIDSIKSIKAPKMPNIFSKTKKGEADLESGKCDESEQLLEETDSVVGDEKDATESDPKDKQKGTSILKSIRSVASGVPTLFKKDSSKDTVIDMEGEKEDLLEKKEEIKEDKTDELKMEDIKLDDDEKKDDLDNKSQGSEKKDPEKGGEVIEEKSKMDRLKRLPSDAARQVSTLDKQKIYGIVGILVGLLLLILIIVIAAVTPRGWRNYHKLVEGGKYVETETSCGKVWGWVEGEDRFLFRSIPYSVDVERFTHSRLPATLDECGDEIRHPNNESRVCMRRTVNGVVGEEDCLTLDIATSSVVYDHPAPVVVYVGGDDDQLVPSSELANSQGVVFVTVSVRQGILGYLSHNLLSETEKPPTSGNYALGDLITALKWVQLNIRHFGGDPDKVTLLGHQQGASLATVLTAVEGGQGLYKRVWATGGAGFIEMLSLEDSSSQFNGVVNSVCKDQDRDCLLEVDAEELVGKVDEDAESWSHDNLPSRGEKSMLSWITLDTQLVKSSFASFWTSSPVSVPIVFGAAAQSEASSANYQLYDWNNTDQVESIMESSLGSFDVSLATGALDLYNSTNNWLEYINMVSDIRTVCPLRQFADIFKSNYSASSVSFYVAQEANPSEDNESGNVADSSTDISAIFGLYEDNSFGEKLQKKFFQFVAGKIDKLGEDVTVFDKEDVKDNDEKCSFWMKSSDEVVPKFAKRF